MKKIFLIFISVFLISCEHPEIKNMLGTVKKRYHNYLELLEHGVISEPRSELGGYDITSTKVNDQLLRLIEIKKDKIYEDDNMKYDRHVALLYLNKSDIITGFNLFKQYIEKYGDDVRPYYHIGALFNTYFRYYYPSWKVVGEIQVDESSNLSRLQLTTAVRLFNRGSFTHNFLASDLNDGSYEEDFKKLNRHLAQSRSMMNEENNYFMRLMNMPYEEYLRKTYLFTDSKYFMPYFTDLEKKESLTIEEMQNLIGYYTEPYNEDPKAIKYVDTLNNVLIADDDFKVKKVAALMKANLADKRYNDVIDLYDKYIRADDEERWLSYCHIYLLVARAYAGLNDIDKSLEFLKKEFEITKIQEPTKRTDPLNSNPVEGSTLESMFLIYFIYDEFQIFWDNNRFSEVEVLMKNNLDRYKDLKFFNRY